MFFLNCKYFSNRKLTEEEENLCDQSIMRALVEYRGFDVAIEMFEKEGYSVAIEERKFYPEQIIAKPPNTDVVESGSSEEISADEDEDL